MLIIAFSLSCSTKIQITQNDKEQPNPDIDRCYVLAQKDTQIVFCKIDSFTETTGFAYVLPYDGRIDPYSKDQKIFYRKEIDTEIIVDEKIGDSIPYQTIQFVDTILQKLYMGIKLVGIDSTKFRDLSEIVTTETKNSENIVLMLNTIIDTSKELHIILFEHSEFFNTSNAFAISSGKHKFIFGNKDLFNSSLLFVHELGHAYGLSHYNKEGSICNKGDTIAPFMNIMHESYIGCAILFSPQQCLIMSNNDFIDNDEKTLNYFPLRSYDDDCQCNTKFYKTELQKYLYSKNRSIHEEPVVGQFELLDSTVYYDTSADSTFIENFKAASELFFEDPINRDSFVSQSMEGLKNLRRDNFTRLFGENMIHSGKQDFDWEDLFSGGIKKYFNIYKDSVITNPLMSVKHCKQDSLKEVVNNLDSIITSLDSIVLVLEKERDFWKNKSESISDELKTCTSTLVNCEIQKRECKTQLARCWPQLVKCNGDIQACRAHLEHCLDCDKVEELITSVLERIELTDNQREDIIASVRSYCCESH